MQTYSTNQAARKLGIGVKTLSRYVALGKVPPPTILNAGGTILHSWTEEEVERVRELLPRLPDGRKTRYTKEALAKKQTRPKKT